MDGLTLKGRVLLDNRNEVENRMKWVKLTLFIPGEVMAKKSRES